jgi:biotin operon repressor
MGNPYSIQDLIFMCTNHGFLTNQEIAEKLGRTKETIASRVYQLKKSGEFEKLCK